MTLFLTTLKLRWPGPRARGATAQCDGGSIDRRERVKVEQGQAAFIADDRLAVRSGMIAPAVPQPQPRRAGSARRVSAIIE